MTERQIETRLAVRFLVRGRVQGVGFRYFVERQARRQGLAGWVRNREDGAVEGEAAGAQDALEGFLALVRRGPPHAQVLAVEVTPLTVVADSTEFHIVG